MKHGGKITFFRRVMKYVMLKWKMNIFREFSLCTHLNIYYFDRYDDLIYQYPEDGNDDFHEELLEAILAAFEELSHNRKKKHQSVNLGKGSELFCTVCYLDESLPELGKVVFGPYTHNSKSKQKVSFLPSFGVQYSIDLLHSFVMHHSHKKGLYSTFDKSISYHFIKIAQFVEEQVSQNITLEIVAENVNLSKPYVCSIVKKATGFTVSQFIAKAKINKAKILFWNGFHDIHEVSLILGYKSQSYFSRQFKMIEGISPKQYVKSLNEDYKR